jgi:hypothetical protein
VIILKDGYEGEEIRLFAPVLMGIMMGTQAECCFCKAMVTAGARHNDICSISTMKKDFRCSRSPAGDEKVVKILK